MIKTYYFASLALALAVSAASCSSDYANGGSDETSGNANANSTILTGEAGRLEFPKVRNDGHSMVVVHYTDGYGLNYSVEWDCEKRAQRWTCYAMYNANSVTNWNRNNWKNATWQGKQWHSDPFQEDPDLPEYCRTTLSDYRGSGFNRGHICPSADRLCSMDANGQTFYLSNMQPQYYNFNAGLWEKMEEQVRSWNRSSFRDTLYVCKGGTIEDYGATKGVMGHTSSGLIVPRYFFMAMLCKKGNTYKAIGLWAEHINADHSSDKLSDYAVSIDELEQLTGIDFFCNLPDDTERRVESISSDNAIRAWGLR